LIFKKVLTLSSVGFSQTITKQGLAFLRTGQIIKDRVPDQESRV